MTSTDSSRESDQKHWGLVQGQTHNYNELNNFGCDRVGVGTWDPNRTAIFFKINVDRCSCIIKLQSASYKDNYSSLIPRITLIFN